MPGIILPRKTVHELHRLIEDSQAPFRSGVGAKARFEIGTITLTSKLIDGTFPDYARVIPKGNDKVLKVSNTDFISAVDRVSTIASERGRAVKLNINRNKLILSVNNPEGGSATEEIGVEYDAAPARDRLQRALPARHRRASSRADSAQFQLADPGSPTMVRDGSDEGALYVLMPMRV
jgi:DNA polymerase-3 subunit beta